MEEISDVVIDMLKVFDFYMYALLDLGATLSFVTPFLSIKFGVSPEILREPFLVYTPMGG